MALMAPTPILVEDELDQDDPSLRDDTRSSDVYSVLEEDEFIVTGFVDVNGETVDSDWWARFWADDDFVAGLVATLEESAASN